MRERERERQRVSERECECECECECVYTYDMHVCCTSKWLISEVCMNGEIFSFFSLVNRTCVELVKFLCVL